LVLERHPFAEFFLILYGTNDAWGMFPVPSGLGLPSSDPGYPGSFKDNLQKIINLIQADGRQAFLAKVPYTRSADINASVLKYNQVITNLAASNGITVVPPDFYAHFQSNPGQLSDTVHPTSRGYESMATLWFNVLQ
jgi:lysophospholipase L1-like esterase